MNVQQSTGHEVIDAWTDTCVCTESQLRRSLDSSFSSLTSQGPFLIFRKSSEVCNSFLASALISLCKCAPKCSQRAHTTGEQHHQQESRQEDQQADLSTKVALSDHCPRPLKSILAYPFVPLFHVQSVLKSILPTCIVMMMYVSTSRLRSTRSSCGMGRGRGDEKG